MKKKVEVLREAPSNEFLEVNIQVVTVTCLYRHVTIHALVVLQDFFVAV